MFLYRFRKLSLLVDDAKLLHDLRRHLRHHILDIDIVANRFLELSVANDQITFDKVVKVLREHNIELDRGLLSRWIKYSRGSASATCSIDKLTDILRRAVDPLLEQLELEDRVVQFLHYRKIVFISLEVWFSEFGNHIQDSESIIYINVKIVNHY